MTQKKLSRRLKPCILEKVQWALSIVYACRAISQGRSSVGRVTSGQDFLEAPVFAFRILRKGVLTFLSIIRYQGLVSTLLPL